uniref:Uncharacterized protein n=1 Tax=Anguilla anguilla TaxID=7936 RepID=A0A0E9RQF0_ANGAN
MMIPIVLVNVKRVPVVLISIGKRPANPHKKSMRLQGRVRTQKSK